MAGQVGQRLRCGAEAVDGQETWHVPGVGDDGMNMELTTDVELNRCVA